MLHLAAQQRPHDEPESSAASLPGICKNDPYLRFPREGAFYIFQLSQKVTASCTDARPALVSQKWCAEQGGRLRVEEQQAALRISGGSAAAAAAPQNAAYKPEAQQH